MTANERYSKCETIEELNAEYQRNKMSAETFEYLDACDRAYKKRCAELQGKEKEK